MTSMSARANKSRFGIDAIGTFKRRGGKSFISRSRSSPSDQWTVWPKSLSMLESNTIASGYGITFVGMALIRWRQTK